MLVIWNLLYWSACTKQSCICVCQFCFFLWFSYWKLELLRQCSIFVFHFISTSAWILNNPASEILVNTITVNLKQSNIFLNVIFIFIYFTGIKSAELYYVRNGIINSYALSFEMPINYDVQEIYFTWQSLRQSPPVSSFSHSLANITHK